MLHVGNAGQRNLERNGDLLFNLFGRAPPATA